MSRTFLRRRLTDVGRTDFIEAQLAKRYVKSQAGSGPNSAGASADETRPGALTSVNAPVDPAKKDKHTALHGKILEIDLGDEVRARNEAMTERARRLAAGEPLEDSQGEGPAKKVRLGRDGKPWQPRNRRGSDAIARDQLVEELMRENRGTPTTPVFISMCRGEERKADHLCAVDNFEKPASADEQYGYGEEDEMGADERVAEEFKRDFLEAMSQRRQARKKTVPTNAPRPGPKRPEGEVLKGPKLGGSRNARAAMRDILLKQQEAAKKG